MSIEVTDLPDSGLVLIFAPMPENPTMYKADLMFNPGTMSEDAIKFYRALGEGLMHIATQETQKVLQLGVNILLDTNEAELVDGATEVFDDDEFPSNVVPIKPTIN